VEYAHCDWISLDTMNVAIDSETSTAFQTEKNSFPNRDVVSVEVRGSNAENI
jgi:hypothetical protein